MRGRAIGLFTLAFATLASWSADGETAEATPPGGGIEVALRLGYGVASGKATGVGSH